MTNDSFYEKRGSLIVVIAVVLLPFVLWAALKSLASNVNDIRDWFPANLHETADYEWFEQHFGHDEFVVITWEDCNLDDPRLEVVTVKLSSLRDSKTGRPLFERVASGSSALDILMSAPTNLSYSAAVRRLKGSLLGSDG